MAVLCNAAKTCLRWLRTTSSFAFDSLACFLVNVVHVVCTAYLMMPLYFVSSYPARSLHSHLHSRTSTIVLKDPFLAELVSSTGGATEIRSRGQKDWISLRRVCGYLSYVTTYRGAVVMALDSWQITDALNLGYGHAQKCNTEGSQCCRIRRAVAGALFFVSRGQDEALCSPQNQVVGWTVTHPVER